jgi:XTP/dITP diphosphohydrolase
VTRLVLATRNAGKVEEMRRLLPSPLEVLSLEDVPPYEPGPETGATFEENALLKAVEAVQHTGLPAVADDSGLSVDPMNGMPGVLSARWAGRHGDDVANLQLGQLADVPDERLTARFVCAAAWALPDGRTGVVRGEMPGRLVRTPRGIGGFGYDPIFVPDGLDRTSAELSPEEKDAISHRGQALRLLVPEVVAVLS